MSKPVYINVNEFMDQLKANGLVIGSLMDFEASRSNQKKRLMRKKALTLKEIVDFELLPLKSKKGVNDWILSGEIKPNEVITGTDAKKTIRVLTSAIRRLGYEE